MTYIGSAVGREVVAGSHHDHSNGSEENHEEETLSTTPKIENLGQRDVDGGSHTVGDNTNDGNERVRLPFTAGIRDQSVVDLALETVGEVDQPHATKVSVQRSSIITG